MGFETLLVVIWTSETPSLEVCCHRAARWAAGRARSVTGTRKQSPIQGKCRARDGCGTISARCQSDQRWLSFTPLSVTGTNVLPVSAGTSVKSQPGPKSTSIRDRTSMITRNENPYFSSSLCHLLMIRHSEIFFVPFASRLASKDAFALGVTGDLAESSSPGFGCALQGWPQSIIWFPPNTAPCVLFSHASSLHVLVHPTEAVLLSSASLVRQAPSRGFFF